nr:hypothetical protein [Tanacetum cinerariifolium]
YNGLLYEEGRYKPYQGDSLNLPDHILIPSESDSTPHAHAQTTKTYKASRFKNQESSNIKTKTSANSDKQDLPSRYQVYQGRLLATFQDDAKYEHGGQDTRSQGGKRRSRQKDKDLKISDEKTKSKDNDKGSRSKITKHEGTSLPRRQIQTLNDNSNLNELTKECHNELTS